MTWRTPLVADRQTEGEIRSVRKGLYGRTVTGFSWRPICGRWARSGYHSERRPAAKAGIFVREGTQVPV